MEKQLKQYIQNNITLFSSKLVKKEIETKNNIIFLTFTFKNNKSIQLPFHLLNYENNYILNTYKFKKLKNKIFLYKNPRLKQLYSNYLIENKRMKGVVLIRNNGGYLIGLNGITSFLPKSHRKNFKVHRLYFKYFYFFYPLNPFNMVISRRVMNPNQFYNSFIGVNLTLIKFYRKKYKKKKDYFERYQTKIFKGFLLLYHYIIRQKKNIKKKDHIYVNKYFYRNKRRKQNRKLFSDQEISHYNESEKDAYQLWSQLYRIR